MASRKEKNVKPSPAAVTGGEDGLNFEELLYDVGQNKNKESFIKLFGYFAPRIKSFLLKGGASEALADELAQETMLNIWNKAQSYDPAKSAASTWIFAVARNKRIDALRKFKTHDIDIDLFPALEDENVATPSQSLIEQQEISRVHDALKTLPEDQAELIRKSFYEDKSHSEIAQETGIPLGTVKSRIRLALERLRREKGIQELAS